MPDEISLPRRNQPAAGAQAARRGMRLPLGSHLESVELLRACIPARTALAALDATIKAVPDADAFVRAHGLLQAIGSQQLSGEWLDTREVLTLPPSQHPESVQRLQSALSDVRQHLQRDGVSSLLALELATDISGAPVSVRRGPAEPDEPGLLIRGKRRLQPPVGAERLQGLLDNWQQFLQRDAGELDPLLTCAVAHGQWLAMRPFTGGNVAVAQALTVLLMEEEGLLSTPCLPLAMHFSRQSSQYWKALHASVESGDPVRWLRWCLAAIETCANITRERLLTWQQLQQEQRAQFVELLPRVPVGQVLPVCQQAAFGHGELATAGFARRQTTANWMKKLVEAGWLEVVRVGKERRYVNKPLLAVLME